MSTVLFAMHGHARFDEADAVDHDVVHGAVARHACSVRDRVLESVETLEARNDVLAHLCLEGAEGELLQAAETRFGHVTLLVGCAVVEELVPY